MRKGRTFFLATVLVLCIMNGLCIMEIDRLRGYYMEDVADQQENYLHAIDAAIELTDIKQSLIHHFEVVYPTSNTTFGFLIEDNEIIYYRNEQGIEQLSSLLISNKGKLINTFSEQSKHVQLDNGIRYIVSYREVNSSDHVYTYGIMSTDEGALERTQSLSVFRHVYLFMGITSVVILIVVYQLVLLLKKNEEELIAWAKQEKANQITIENLSNDLRTVRKSKNEDTIYGMFRKEDVINIMKKLSNQQLEQCYLVKIHLEHSQGGLYIAAILQRMEVLKCVSCEWQKDIFVVLLLHGDPIQLEHVLRYVLQTYQYDYHENPDDLRITTQKLRSGKDGISTI